MVNLWSKVLGVEEKFRKKFHSSVDLGVALVKFRKLNVVSMLSFPWSIKRQCLYYNICLFYVYAKDICLYYVYTIIYVYTVCLYYNIGPMS